VCVITYYWQCSSKERLRLKKEQRKAAREGSDDEDAAAMTLSRAGKKQGKAVEGEEGGFNVDLSDPRFSEIFRDHSFALDPTDPRFVQASFRDPL
jgi:hypothetical protein